MKSKNKLIITIVIALIIGLSSFTIPETKVQAVPNGVICGMSCTVSGQAFFIKIKDGIIIEWTPAGCCSDGPWIIILNCGVVPSGSHSEIVAQLNENVDIDKMTSDGDEIKEELQKNIDNWEGD